MEADELELQCQEYAEEEVRVRGLLEEQTQLRAAEEAQKKVSATKGVVYCFEVVTVLNGRN